MHKTFGKLDCVEKFEEDIKKSGIYYEKFSDFHFRLNLCLDVFPSTNNCKDKSNNDLFRSWSFETIDDLKKILKEKF